MSPLGQFMNELLKHHKGEVEIINDNARLTNKQKRKSLQVTRDNLQSSSSNHSNTRWEMDGSNHSTEVRHSTSALNSLSSVPTAPIRKPSNDPPQGISDRNAGSLDISSHKAEKRLDKYLGKNSKHFRPPPQVPRFNVNAIFSPSFTRKAWNQESDVHHQKKGNIMSMNDIFPPESVTAPNTPEISPIPSQPSDVVSLTLIKPSRKLSPKEEELRIPQPIAELNRSLSKVLLGVDDDPQAPKLPTRRPSKQPDLNSPVSRTCAESSSADAYSQMVADISLSPLNAPVGRKNSDKSLSRPTQETLPSEPPLAKKSKQIVFPKTSSKWLGALGKRN